MAFGVALKQNKVVGQDTKTTSAAVATPANTETVTPKTPEQLKNDPAVIHAKALSNAFREAAGAATPSVVTVYSHETAKKVKAHGENPSTASSNSARAAKTRSRELHLKRCSRTCPATVKARNSASNPRHTMAWAPA